MVDDMRRDDAEKNAGESEKSGEPEIENEKNGENVSRETFPGEKEAEAKLTVASYNANRARWRRNDST